MTKTLFYYFLFFFVINSSAQTWVDSNPVWYYFYSKGGLDASFGEFKITQIGDSIIEGKNCQGLQQEKSVWYESGGTGYYLWNEIVDTNYVRVEGDTVFYYQGGQFRTLYNFGSNVGDSWLIHVTNEPSNCEDSCFVIVTDTGFKNIETIDYRYISLETIGDPDFKLNGTFVERFGKYSDPLTVQYSDGTLFPYSTCQDNFEFTDFTLGCFSDDLLNYQVFTECYGDPSESSLLEYNTNSIVVFPNPIVDYLTCQGIESNSIVQIVDSKGVIVKTFQIKVDSELINFAHLEAGAYILKIISNNTVINKSILKL